MNSGQVTNASVVFHLSSEDVVDDAMPTLNDDRHLYIPALTEDADPRDHPDWASLGEVANELNWSMEHFFGFDISCDAKQKIEAIKEYFGIE